MFFQTIGKTCFISRNYTKFAAAKRKTLQMSKDKSIWKDALISDSEHVTKGIGKNVIPVKEKESLWSKYLEKFKDPIIIILLVILALSIGVTAYEICLSHDMRLLFEPAGILMAILLSTGIGFIFEVKADREFEILNKVKDDEPVKVLRRAHAGTKPQMIKIRKCDVVTKDIVRLESGDEVPADGEIIEAEGLKVDESAFTGEPYASKSAERIEDHSETYAPYFLLRGSHVIEGSCFYKVTATGQETEEGQGQIKLEETEEIQTPLNRQLGTLGKILTRLSYGIAVLIFIGRIIFASATGEFNTFDIHDIEYILHSIMIAVTLIVVAVPEGLPMSVTMSLALSMRKMLKEKNLVRRLHACETMGAATVICTDKTGTLTENKMTVVAHDVRCSIEKLSENISVNSTAELSVKENGELLAVGNPTECALLKWLKNDFDTDYIIFRKNLSTINVIPFTTERKYMETTVEDKETGRKTQYIKGAPEIVMAMCGGFSGDGSEESFKALLEQYQKSAMRTLAFAHQDIVDGEDTALLFDGIAGIADPVREGVKEAILTCTKGAHVRVIMVTGDVAATANEIGRQIGLADAADGISLTGQEFAQMSDDEVCSILPDLRILSRARPDDKARLVRLLQKQGEVVAVTGDGTNDALALKTAQVGMSMGDGTARAKEVSDITILDNSFASINKAILWGRSLYRNIRRFIIFQMTINFCACILVLIGAFIGADSPLTVTQMLWVNLIMDTFAAMALSSLPADPTVMTDRPRRQDEHILNKAMTTRIIGTGLAFFGILIFLWEMLLHNPDITSVKEIFSSPGILASTLHNDIESGMHLSDIQRGIFFSIFVMMQFWNLFNVRYFKTGSCLILDLIDMSKKRSRLSDHYSAGFFLTAGLILIGQILIVNFAGPFFNVARLTLQDWILIISLTMPIWLVHEIYAIIMKYTGRRS